MKPILLTAVATFAVATACYATEAKMKAQYKLFHFNAFEVGVSCLNDADPTVKKVDNVLVVSCGNNVYR